MNKEEFLKMDDKAQLEYLNGLVAQGKSFNDICAELGMDRVELGKYGFYFVKNQFMHKPMKGYQTTIRSGNEQKL